MDDVGPKLVTCMRYQELKVALQTTFKHSDPLKLIGPILHLQLLIYFLQSSSEAIDLKMQA